MRVEGYAGESILRVLRQQGLRIAARTYRAWKNPTRTAARTVTDALVEDKIRELAWTTNPVTGLIQTTPEASTGDGSGSPCSVVRRASPARLDGDAAFAATSDRDDILPVSASRR